MHTNNQNIDTGPIQNNSNTKAQRNSRTNTHTHTQKRKREHDTSPQTNKERKARITLGNHPTDTEETSPEAVLP